MLRLMEKLKEICSVLNYGLINFEDDSKKIIKRKANRINFKFINIK